MHFRLYCFVATILMAIIRPSVASEIIMPTEYRDDEARVTLGESWLALQPFKGEWRLVPAAPRFAAIPDAIFGDRIRVKSNVKHTLVLLADMSLKAGPVGRSLGGRSTGASDQQKYENSRLPEIGKSREFYLTGRIYELKNLGGRLTLFSQGISQYLFDYSEKDESNAEIVWVGDLDRDGRLDLILDTSDHNNVSFLTLYLSDGAPSGSLVRHAASRKQMGC